MGLFSHFENKRRYSVKSAPKTPKNKEISLLGFVLLRTAFFDVEHLFTLLQEEFGKDMKAEVRQGTLLAVSTEVSGKPLMITHMPRPVPNDEIKEQIDYNLLPPESLRGFRNHASFLIVNAMNTDAWKRNSDCMIFSRVCYALTKLKFVAGVYMGGAGLLITPQEYEKQMAIVKSEQNKDGSYFPTPLWIRVTFRVQDGKKQAITSGMGDFGFYDFCFYETEQDPQTLFEWLHLMCLESLTGKSYFETGKSIRFNDELTGIFKLEDDILYIIGV